MERIRGTRNQTNCGGAKLEPVYRDNRMVSLVFFSLNRRILTNHSIE